MVDDESDGSGEPLDDAVNDNTADGNVGAVDDDGTGNDDYEELERFDAEPETKAVQDSLEPAQAGTTARGHSWKRESVMGLDCKHV